MFNSDFLEKFTHISPVTVLLLWLPVATILLWVNAAAGENAWLRLPAGVLIGMIMVWTFIEYVMHRFIFHFKPRNDWQEKLLFVMHEVHHVQPNCKTRLVMPPILSVSIAAAFWVMFVLVVDKLLGAPIWVAPLFAGSILGYVSYDMTHYAVHHFPLTHPLFKAVKRHHLLHHFDDPNTRYGVTSPIWDYVFKTQKGEFFGKGR